MDGGGGVEGHLQAWHCLGKAEFCGRIDAGREEKPGVRLGSATPRCDDSRPVVLRGCLSRVSTCFAITHYVGGTMGVSELCAVLETRPHSSVSIYSES